MRQREDVEAYLIRSGQKFREVSEGTWLVRDVDDRAIAVKLTDDLVIFRVKVADCSSAKNHEALFKQLLSWNAQDMVQGAYGIVGTDIVLTAALRLENLDYNEFQGILDDFSMAITNHRDTLTQLQS